MTTSTDLIVDDLEVLLRVLPEGIREALNRIGRWDDLLEIILDLGRVPTARYVAGEEVLLEREVTREEIAAVVENIGDFDADNRAGIERTLHRISGIRNRRGDVVGLTCRVGRAVFGTIEILKDLITSGKSVLLLGRPAVGKTTMLRESARVLAETKRVVIVDTSNEIAGDGDIPHPAIGRARRMQVAMPSLQHEVMIEAVENHNPEVIVIDEIGRELEAMAARTIAERGVQLIATAHGNTMENLMLNPTLSDLVGGIESVTLSDEEARRRGTQKTVLERRAPPTFNILVEIQERQKLLIHSDVAESVDAIVRGSSIPHELRYRDDAGKVRVEQWRAASPDETAATTAAPAAFAGVRLEKKRRKIKEKRVYLFGISRDKLSRAAEQLRVPLRIVNNLGDAQVFVTSKQHFRKRPRAIADAERRGIPMFVLRANTRAQMESFLADLFELTEQELDPFSVAMSETETAIERVLMGAQPAVDLTPQDPFVRRYQHEMAREANLVSRSHGQEPRRSVRIYRE